MWLFSLEPESLVCPRMFWGLLEDRLEALASEEINFYDKKVLVSTIRIAKSLVQFENTLQRSPQFWRLFMGMIKDEKF